MTEDEAKKKWCPFVRHLGDEGRASYNVNAIGRRPATANCVASACMAWRWAYNPDLNAPRYHGGCGLAGYGR